MKKNAIFSIMLTSYRQSEKIQDFYSGQSSPGGWIKAEKATFLVYKTANFFVFSYSFT